MLRLMPVNPFKYTFLLVLFYCFSRMREGKSYMSLLEPQESQIPLTLLQQISFITGVLPADREVWGIAFILHLPSVLYSMCSRLELLLKDWESNTGFLWRYLIKTGISFHHNWTFRLLVKCYAQSMCTAAINSIPVFPLFRLKPLRRLCVKNLPSENLLSLKEVQSKGRGFDTVSFCSICIMPLDYLCFQPLLYSILEMERRPL